MKHQNNFFLYNHSKIIQFYPQVNQISKYYNYLIQSRLDFFTDALIELACACMLSSFSGVGLFVTLKTIACQAPLSMGFSRQEYWSGLPSPLPGDLLHPGTEPSSLMSAALAGRFFTTSATWEAPKLAHVHIKKEFKVYKIKA